MSLGYMLYRFAGAQTQGETYKIDDMDLNQKQRSFGKTFEKTVVDREKTKGK